jgi:hypothetical protein
MGTKWTASGEYIATCSCDLLCPCLARNNLTAATRNLINGFRISWGKVENPTGYFTPFNCATEAA